MSDRHPTRIVIAEDDTPTRVLLERQLTKAGYDVIACENGMEALEAIRKEVSSCIVVADWMMPEMDGLELCTTVRTLGEMQVLAFFIYFILLTAHSETKQIVTGLEAGADDYVTKPYHKQELLARIRVGERIAGLQTELRQQQIELHKINSKFATLNQKLDDLAKTDVLTGLANRRHLLERFAEVWALVERNNQPLGCIMLDIDKFKSINDTLGHAAGDIVLKKLAETCRQCLRRYDVLGRIGGEEFCIICPDSPVKGIAHVAERIRDAVEQTEFHAGDKLIPVTVSLGVAGRNETHRGPDDLTSAADAMLYRAKESGRNQVWIRDSQGNAARFGNLAGVS